MSLREVLLVSTQTLAAAKTYDASCGGASQFIVIDSHGSISPVQAQEIQKSESYISDYETAVRQLLFYVADSEMEDSRFEGRLQNFNEVVRSLRAFWRDKGDEYLESLVSRFTATNQQGPQSTKVDSLRQLPSQE